MQAREENPASPCLAGGWGARRRRTSECRATIAAEDVYTALLEGPQGGRSLARGAGGTIRWPLPDRRTIPASWETVADRVCRFGRVFRRCGICGRRATRPDLPVAMSVLGCRSWHALTYDSQTSRNYKRHVPGGYMGGAIGHAYRDRALAAAVAERHRRKATTAVRHERRRRLPGRRECDSER